MASSYDLVIKGKDGADAPNPKTPGEDGKALGPGGNGTPGEGFLIWCTKDAGVGKPGNRGDTAPPAASGENADDAYAVILTCNSFEGKSFSVMVAGGDGGKGGDGGRGGNGSTGGNAGKQPSQCTEVINGGVGGNSGAGGTAGNGGCGGNSADIAVICGPNLPTSLLSTTNDGGDPGLAGTPGDGGDPGLGGKNSDGTPNLPGGRSGGGGQGTDGSAGASGRFEAASDMNKPPNFLEIAVKPYLAPKKGCGA